MGEGRPDIPPWRTLAGLIFVIALVIAALHFTASRRVQVRPRSVCDTRSMLGTYVTITVVADSESEGRQHLAAAFARLADLEKRLSAHRPDSELARVNEAAARGPVAVSDDLYRVIEAGVAWHPRTLGAFDIAVSPLVSLWQVCGAQDRLPTPEELRRVRPLLGANRIVLDPVARTVRFPVGGMRLDLGGLGKGYCADEVAGLLRRRGVRNALVAMSGDIYALGRREDGQPWRIGVQDPRRPDSPDALITVLELSDKAVSTSGNYQRFVEIQGRRYSHIVDPRSGLTADNVPSVTVIGPDTLTTDVLDTALSVLGAEHGLALVGKMAGVEALFVSFDERNEPRIVRSKGFPDIEVGPGPRDAHLK